MKPNRRNVPTFQVKVLGVEEYEGRPTFLVAHGGRSYHVWKYPFQPDTLNTLTCELHMATDMDGKPFVFLRQADCAIPKDELSATKLNILPVHANIAEDWSVFMHDHTWHRYGNNSSCTMCKRHFDTNRGWKIDNYDVFFCDLCKTKIQNLMKSDDEKKGWVRIISTPMGRK